MPPPCPDVAAALSQLTEREVQVLRLLATGRSNAEIARELFLKVGLIRPSGRNPEG